ncbi:rRNA biogenesis protein RRP36 domain-containing protein [Sarocladium implicatum]|nr:rRNA biogenesis protein RRP36 domain-containing protein [Sarocladium implicatum]
MPEKRKQPSFGLQRRVKARKEEDWEPDLDVSDDTSDNDQVSEEGLREDDSEDDDESASEGEDDGSREESDSGPEDTSSRPKVDLSSISFGALAKAQESLPQSSRRKGSKSTKQDSAEPTTERKSLLSRERESATKMSSKKPPARTSKNAPQEQSSKHPVSRRREILTDPRRHYRDPRFDTLGASSSSSRTDELKVQKAYSFLDEYRESEMTELRKRIKKTTDEAQKSALKRELHSMESRKKTQERKAETERVLKEHREQEKEKVAQGKTPFYLKKSEQKKIALTDRFKGMSKGQVDRAIERKRKKVAGREKKELGSMERVRRQ